MIRRRAGPDRRAVGAATLSFGFKLDGGSVAAGVLATALAFGLLSTSLGSNRLTVPWISPGGSGQVVVLTLWPAAMSDSVL